MTTIAVHVQCVHTLRVRIATSRKQHIERRAKQHVGGGKFSETTEARFCHAHHFPRRQTNGFSKKNTKNKTLSMTSTSMSVCEVCRTRAQNQHVASTLGIVKGEFIGDRVRVDLMRRVRDPSVPESGGGRLARRSSDRRRRAISHLERPLSNCCRSGPPWRRNRREFEFQPRISFACNRKTICASHRDAAGSVRDCQGHWWNASAAKIDSCRKCAKEHVQPRQGA